MLLLFTGFLLENLLKTKLHHRRNQKGMKKPNKKKPYLGRIPIPRPGNVHKDKSKYTRKNKHKGGKI